MEKGGRWVFLYLGMGLFVVYYSIINYIFSYDVIIMIIMPFPGRYISFK